jgi:hypothetical protein
MSVAMGRVPGEKNESSNAAAISKRMAVETSIILPAYNEAEALPTVLQSLFDLVNERYEVIVVDDGSTDETVAIAAKFPCTVLRHDQNRGKGAALRTGLQGATGRFIIVMDADATYPVSAIPKLVAELSDHDFVRGVRRSRDKSMPLVNRIGNGILDRTLWLLHGVQGEDQLTGLYGLRRDILNDMHIASQGFDLETEIDIKARARHLRASSIPIEYRPRLGEKKLHPLRDGFRILRRALALAVLYNPLLTFFVPAMLVWALDALLLLDVSAGWGSATHRGEDVVFVLVLGASVGLQFLLAGSAVSLYAGADLEPQSMWLTHFGHRRFRVAAATAGSLMAAFGSVLIALTVLSPSTLSLFGVTHGDLFVGLLLFGGLQLIIWSAFLSLFDRPGSGSEAV